jgi:hypothetical protein
MTSYFTLQLDSAPPANPVILLNGGAVSTGDLIVLATLSSPDYDGGALDVAEMLIWGDVDPTGDALIQPSQANSTWRVFQPGIPIVLSAGAGSKNIYAQIRDDVHNTTVTFSATIIYDPTIPVVSITRGVTKDKISLQTLYNEVDFTWQSNQDYQSYEVRVVGSVDDPRGSGVVIPNLGGSINTQGGSGTANTTVLTTVYGADLQSASPGDTLKLIKVYVQNLSGTWSV